MCSAVWSHVFFGMLSGAYGGTDSLVPSELQRLHHPGQIKTLQRRRRNCLILPSCFQNTAKQKVMGWGVAWREASAARLLSCSILSLYHLIRRMWRCGEESLSAWDGEGGASSCSFPSPGPAPSSTLLYAWMTPIQEGVGWWWWWGHGGVTWAPGSTSETNGCGESEDGKACFTCAWKKSMYWS